MRALIAFVATLGLVFLAAPASASSSVGLAAIPCSGGVCDTINDVCGDCIPAADGEAADRCAADPCGTLNTVCRKTFHADCVRADAPVAVLEETRCMGPVCDAVNAACWIALKTWCVG